MTASVYTIHAFSPFLETLGACLRDDRFGFGLPFGTGPETSDMTVLLPTRRACRAFREVLLAQSGGRATFLPRIRPIGDADEDELLMQGGAEGDPLLPEAPSGLTRDLHLMRLILRWRKTLAADGDAAIPQTAADALWLARQLGVLLDLIETEGGDLSRLSSLVPEDFAAHYGLTLSFLTIVSDWWPAWLEETGQIGSAERRNRLIAAECRRIEAGDTAGPIVAAGSPAASRHPPASSPRSRGHHGAHWCFRASTPCWRGKRARS